MSRCGLDLSFPTVPDLPYDKIVGAIERGAGDFRLPWHRSAGSIMRPVNIASKKSCRGVNVVALWAYAEEFGYSSGIWGAYKLWNEAGAQVRKGEKAAFVVIYKELEFAADPETGDAETATRIFARATPVFAAEQVDGYQPPVIDAPPVTAIAVGRIKRRPNERTAHPHRWRFRSADLQDHAGVRRWLFSIDGGAPCVKIWRA